MSVNDHWMYQGRQSHGWFGTGTAPKGDVAEANELFRPANAGERVDAAAPLIIADVPRNERGRWSYAASDTGRDRLKTAVAAWHGASAMNRDAFRTQFLNPYTSDETVDRLRGAARGLIEAQSYDQLAKAGSDLSATARKIGPDRWPQFIGNAAKQAEEAVSRGDVPSVIKADVGTDALVGVAVMGALGLAIGSLLDGQTSKLPPATTTTPVLMATPPRDAKDPNGAKAPGKPGAAEGFSDPKGGESWVPTGPGDDEHDGPHWDVQSPGGKYKNIYPGGRERPGR